jgi:hypothetical protein
MWGGRGGTEDGRDRGGEMRGKVWGVGGGGGTQ